MNIVYIERVYRFVYLPFSPIRLCIIDKPNFRADVPFSLYILCSCVLCICSSEKEEIKNLSIYNLFLEKIHLFNHILIYSVKYHALLHARETCDFSPKRGLGKMITRNFRVRSREAKREIPCQQGKGCR